MYHTHLSPLSLFLKHVWRIGYACHLLSNLLWYSHLYHVLGSNLVIGILAVP
jgi:hypothetical protein